MQGVASMSHILKEFKKVAEQEMYRSEGIKGIMIETRDYGKKEKKQKQTELSSKNLELQTIKIISKSKINIKY